jgi:hypothetical protein
MAEFDQQHASYTKLVDRYSRYIESPVLRLKFLDTAMRKQPRQKGRLRVKWVPVAGALSERAMLILELSKFLPPNRKLPLTLKLAWLLYRVRFAVYGVCFCLSMASLAGLIYTAAKLVSNLSVPSQAKSIASSSSAGASYAQVFQPVAIKEIVEVAGLPPEKVWLAETGNGFEFYSNGARILTELETNGPARRFYKFDLDGRASADKVMSEPVGIVYHTSESDLLPFSGSYNSSLQMKSRALVEYARDHRLYNYVIDRFGRIYRIVRDEMVASHAGNSVWSDGRSIYINLSASFIGVCLEGKSASGSAVGPDGINEAQIYAARVLTAVLRSKYNIEDANCVTHGLVSINPSNHLMGYHTDWAAGFPFEALGVSNKYELELMAISRFGFGYDQAYIASAGGKRWRGLEIADAKLAELARDDGLSLEQERKLRQRAFQRAYAQQLGLDRRQ